MNIHTPIITGSIVKELGDVVSILDKLKPPLTEN